MPLKAAVDTSFTKFSPRYTYKCIRVGLCEDWIELTPVLIEGYSMIGHDIIIHQNRIWVNNSKLSAPVKIRDNKLKDGIYITGCSICVLSSNPALRT